MYWKNDGALPYGGVPLNVALGPRPAVGMPPVMLPTVGVVIPPVGEVIPPVGVLTLYTGVGVVGVVLNVGGGGAVLIVAGGGVLLLTVLDPTVYMQLP